MSDLKKQPAPKASIVLLTRNSAETIRGVLDGIIKQQFQDYEILLIDSSSNDDTVRIANDYPCKIVSIKPGDFGHGKTRNYAAKLTKGEFIVFLTHDSMPESKSWLSELLKPFSDKKVAGVYGQQVPRPDENILDKHFQASLYGSKKKIWKADNWKQGDNIFSDANSAVRKSILLKYPYANDIIVSEDYEWAARMLKLNYRIIYSTDARVIHSHSYDLWSLFRRNFDVGVSYRDIYTSDENNALAAKGLEIVKQEIKYLYGSGHVLLIPNAILRDCTRFIAIQLGKHEQLFTKKFKRNHLSAQKWYWV